MTEWKLTKDAPHNKAVLVFFKSTSKPVFGVQMISPPKIAIGILRTYENGPVRWSLAADPHLAEGGEVIEHRLSRQPDAWAFLPDVFVVEKQLFPPVDAPTE